MIILIKTLIFLQLIIGLNLSNIKLKWHLKIDGEVIIVLVYFV